MFCGEKSNESYKIGSTLTLYNAQYGYRNVASLCVKYFTTVVFKVMPLLEIINIKQEDVFTSPGVMFVKEEQSKLCFSIFTKVKNICYILTYLRC